MSEKSAIQWNVMAPIFAVTTMGGVAMGVILPLLPFYSTQFGASPFVVGLIVAVFAACQFISGPILGRYSDKYGRKPVLIISQMGMLAGLVMLAGAQSLWMIFAARILDGLTAGNLSVAAAAAADSSTPATRRQAMGIVGAAMGLGFIIGPALPALLPFSSISASIWFASGLQLITLIATWIFFPHNKPKAKATPEIMKPKQRYSAVLDASSTLNIFFALGIFYFVFAGFMSQFALFTESNFSIQGLPVNEKQIAWIFSGMGAINVFVQLVLMKQISKFASDKAIAIASYALVMIGFMGIFWAQSFVALCMAVAFLAFGNVTTRINLMAALSLSAPADQQGAVMGMNQSIMAAMGIVAPPLSGLLITHHFYHIWPLLGAGITALGLVVVMSVFSRKLWPSIQPELS